MGLFIAMRLRLPLFQLLFAAVLLQEDPCHAFLPVDCGFDIALDFGEVVRSRSRPFCPRLVTRRFKFPSLSRSPDHMEGSRCTRKAATRLLALVHMWG